MKNIKLALSFSLLLVFAGMGCEDDDYVVYEGEAFQKVADAFLRIKTPVIGFQAGTPSYLLEFDVVNGDKRVNTVEVYKTFTDATTGATTNEALLKSYPMDNDGITTVADQITYEDLKAGLLLNGAALTDDQTQLAVGSTWVLRFVAKRDDGDQQMIGGARVAVLSRFAGLYRVVASEYYRIGVLTSTWNDQIRFIGSVDANTFSYNDFWGPFAWAGKSFHFDIDESTNLITVPIITSDGMFSGNRPLDCAVEPATFSVLDCSISNVLIPDDATGHHTIKLTYGYFTNGSGPREFQETLVKI